MPTLAHTVEISIEFGDAVPLEDLESQKSLLKRRGIYLLLSGPPVEPVHLGKNVFYIGKAISETIFSRGKKHADSISGALLRTGNPKTRPGKKLQAFREQQGNRLTDLFLVPGYMHGSKAFQVSCAEEWLIWSYSQIHGAIPEANTYAAKDL